MSKLLLLVTICTTAILTVQYLRMRLFSERDDEHERLAASLRRQSLLHLNSEQCDEGIRSTFVFMTPEPAVLTSVELYALLPSRGLLGQLSGAPHVARIGDARWWPVIHPANADVEVGLNERYAALYVKELRLVSVLLPRRVESASSYALVVRSNLGETVCQASLAGVNSAFPVGAAPGIRIPSSCETIISNAAPQEVAPPMNESAACA